MSVRFSVKMDGNLVKIRPRQVRRKRLEIQRLRSMSSTESDGITKNRKTTTTTTKKQQKKKKLRIKVVPSCESGILLDDESTVEERLQCTSHGSISVCGRRREMEDAVSVIPGFLSEIDFFGVYDGHGGSRVAQECSEKLHRLLAEEMMIDQRSDGVGGNEDHHHHHFDEDWEKILVSCFLKMDEEVSGSRGGGGLEVDDMKSIGSTAVVALIGKDKIIVANCGDSRAVMSRGGVAVPLSRDHKELEDNYSYLMREIYSVNVNASKIKPDRSDELERVEAAGGRVINWNGYRVLGVLATSRSIGDHYLKPYVISVPEVLVTERTKSDEFLILASDGLWDVLSNEQACDVARRCLGGRIMRRITKSNVANRLVDGAARVASKSNIAANRFVDGATRAAAVLTELAMARGSKDNISVVVIELNKMDKMNRDSSS